MSNSRNNSNEVTMARHRSTESIRRASEEEKRADPKIQQGYYHPTRLFWHEEAKQQGFYNGITDPLIGAKLPLEPIEPIDFLIKTIKSKSP